MQLPVFFTIFTPFKQIPVFLLSHPAIDIKQLITNILTLKSLPDLNHTLARYFKILLFLFFTINSGCAFASLVAEHRANVSVFQQIKSIPLKGRVAFANNIYKSTLRKVSPKVAMSNLDSLSAIAVSLNDKLLECSVFEMRADYYSVNHGFNAISTSWYQKAIDFATNNNLLFERGFYLYRIGIYYFIYTHNSSACQYFLRAQEIFNQIGYNHIPAISTYLAQIANFYYALGDYDTARENLVTALHYVPAASRENINIINTIGLIYRNKSQFPQALAYFNSALKMAVAARDTNWIGIAGGNIGAVYFLQDHYQKALPYIEADYQTSLKYKDPVNGVIALLRLIKINIAGNNFNQTKKQLQFAEVLLKKCPYDVLALWTNYYDLQAQYYELIGQPATAITYRKIFEQHKDSLAKRDNLTSVERVKLRWETDQRVAELNKLKADSKIKSIEMNAGIAVIILLIIISILLYNRQRLNSKKDKELLLAEKRIVDEQLKSANAALQLYTENILRKNILIEQFKLEIANLDKPGKAITDAGNLEKLLQARIMTDDNWNDFKNLFSKVYPGFFVNLNKSYPNLSTTDTRILTLIKLGLSNTEMSNMLGITIDGIKKSKQRLRKKIGMDAIDHI